MASNRKRQDEEDYTYPVFAFPDRGKGPGSGGQSGDTQGLSELEDGSESVTELVEEGQYFEAEVMDGIENAPDADANRGRGVRTKQVREDDIPPEYLDDEQRDI
jgi:hypothetical protein